MTNSRIFTHINESFVCQNCGKEVPPLAKGCRNHCPFCLNSKHVDHNPGDRGNQCHGLMEATSYTLSGKKGLVLHFTCKVCKAETSNIAAHEDSIQADDYDLILSLSKEI